MAVKSKKSVNNDSALYIQDADAKALGIIEGSAQKIFINGKEVEVVYVDEYEVIPATNEERKILQDAEKIAAKYESVYANEGKATSRTMTDYSAHGDKESSNFIKKVFQASTYSKEPKVKQPKELKTKKGNVVSNDFNSFQLKNESFTVEELDIIKEIISNTPGKANASSKALVPSTKKPTSKVSNTSKSKSKTKAKSKTKSKAKSKKKTSSKKSSPSK
ncbi:MAG: hypothetical protein ACRC42_05080 [Mycoplasma sp.]